MFSREKFKTMQDPILHWGTATAIAITKPTAEDNKCIREIQNVQLSKERGKSGFIAIDGECWESNYD